MKPKWAPTRHQWRSSASTSATRFFTYERSGCRRIRPARRTAGAGSRLALWERGHSDLAACLLVIRPALIGAESHIPCKLAPAATGLRRRDRQRDRLRRTADDRPFAFWQPRCSDRSPPNSAERVRARMNHPSGQSRSTIPRRERSWWQPVVEPNCP
jgi:hypothetical protein